MLYLFIMKNIFMMDIVKKKKIYIIKNFFEHRKEKLYRESFYLKSYYNNVTILNFYGLKQ